LTAKPSPELVLIRHAPTDAEGRLCGRTDVSARMESLAELDRLRTMLAPITRRVASPALRCRQTAKAFWPVGTVEIDERLREQDFGEWDGLPFSQVPDLGTLSRDDLAAHRPPGGESFADLCARVAPALNALAAEGTSIAIVAHAGTVRAALALALGTIPPALTFEVAPLSVTRLRCLGASGMSLICANCPAA
jgi:alpha-ribazole phosphatase